MQPIFVQVRSGSQKASAYERKLKKFGLEEEQPNVYSGTISSSFTLRRLKRFSHSAHLKLLLNPAYSARSSNYRALFFETHHTEDNKYRCVYCGRKFPKEKITIDHVYPVSPISKHVELQKKLQRKGIENVNSQNNLVPACWKCNKRKGEKMGIWIWKAKLGTNNWYWIVKRIIQSFIIIGILLLLYFIITGKI